MMSSATSAFIDRNTQDRKNPNANGRKTAITRLTDKPAFSLLANVVILKRQNDFALTTTAGWETVGSKSYDRLVASNVVKVVASLSPPIVTNYWEPLKCPTAPPPNARAIAAAGRDSRHQANDLRVSGKLCFEPPTTAADNHAQNFNCSS